METIIPVLAWLGSVSDVCSTLPQVWKCRHPRTTHNLAAGMILLRLLGAGCWSVWGFYHRDITFLIVIGPLIAFVLELILLCCMVRDELLPPDDSECNDALPTVSKNPYELSTLQKIQSKNRRVEI